MRPPSILISGTKQFSLTINSSNAKPLSLARITASASDSYAKCSTGKAMRNR
jgi:hypothetical protein